MKHGLIMSLALAAIQFAVPALAQDMPDIGFKSVGRGRPLAASVHDQRRADDDLRYVVSHAGSSTGVRERFVFDSRVTLPAMHDAVQRR